MRGKQTDAPATSGGRPRRSGRFLWGDLLANATVGLVAAAAVHYLVAPGQPMIPAMFLGMAVGMGVGEILAIALFMRLFGDAEIMLSVMLSGMLAGMVVSMARAMYAVDLAAGLAAALFLSFASVAIVRWLDGRFGGRVRTYSAEAADSRWNRVRRRRDRVAPYFDQITGRGPIERWAPVKRRFFGDMGQGDILFLNVGTGTDFGFLPAFRKLVGTDISDGMLRRARARARDYPGEIHLEAAPPHNLPYPDGCFDQVFTSLSFAWLPEPELMLLEIERVLKQGGRLHMFEQGRSRIIPFNVMLFVMTLLYRPAGVVLNRDIEGMVRAAGLQLELRENVFLDVVRVIRAAKRDARQVAS